jgi:hypothetical protein
LLALNADCPANGLDALDAKRFNDRVGHVGLSSLPHTLRLGHVKDRDHE